MNAPLRAFHDNPATKLTIMNARIHGRRGVSCHADNDDLRHWQFVRNSRIPWGTFDRPLWPRAASILVILVPAVGVALALIFQW